MIANRIVFGCGLFILIMAALAVTVITPVLLVGTKSVPASESAVFSAGRGVESHVLPVCRIH